jgi:hypothetical protein
MVEKFFGRAAGSLAQTLARVEFGVSVRMMEQTSYGRVFTCKCPRPLWASA